MGAAAGAASYMDEKSAFLRRQEFCNAIEPSQTDAPLV